eukprot:m.174973 g.174973  ORF g.174973 m.174973 type:complete len:272 (-) comp15332_c0_seq1:59-874(-)
MRIDDHAIASRAFRRRVDLEPEDFESWSNLANALLRLGHKPRAFLALKEAIRAEYENWKVWENLCAVAIDVGAFNDVIFSFNRIFDLKKSFGDHEILNLVVRAVNENLLDFDNQPCSNFAPALRALIDRLPSVTVTDYRVWLAAAHFLSATGDAKRAQDFRRNAYRDARAASGWEKAQSSLLGVLKCAEEVVKGMKQLSCLVLIFFNSIPCFWLNRLNFSGYIALGTDSDKASAKLMLRSLLAAASASPHASDATVAAQRETLAALAAQLA